MASTYTLQNSIDWSSGYLYQRPQALLGPSQLEPAITNANLILSTILGPPFRWRWNRSVTGFVTTAGVQDYLLTVWAANLVVTKGTYVIDNAGNSQLCTTAGTTGTGPGQPTWTNTTTTDGSVVWTYQGAIPQAGQTLNFGWIEGASVLDPSDSKWHAMNPKIGLELDFSSGRPDHISCQIDNGQGPLVFRVMSVPDAPYPIALTLQNKTILMSTAAGTGNTWTPIPDEYMEIYNWGYLSLGFMRASDPRWAAANQKFVGHLLATQDGLTQTQINAFLSTWQAITGMPVALSIAETQGGQARGI